MHLHRPIALSPMLMCKAGAILRCFRQASSVCSPGQVAYLLQERRVNCQILGHHIEAEEVPVDAGAGHGEAVQVLVLLTSYLEQLEPLLRLGVNRTRICFAWFCCAPDHFLFTGL